MTANPTRTHGSRRSFMSDTEVPVNAHPSSRRSHTTVRPTNSNRNRTCVDSTRGYMNSDSRSAVLPPVAASHSQNASSDTLLGVPDRRIELLVAVDAGVVHVGAGVE